MNSIKTNIYPENDYRTYLIHYGKKGQKWGVRNAEWYPIADWEAHLKRTGGNSKSAGSGRVTNEQSGSTSSSSGSSKAMAEVKAILDGKKTFKSKTDMLNAVCQDCFCPSAHANYITKSHEREREAAELGLKAIEKLRGPGYIDEDPYEYIDPKTKKTVSVSSEEMHNHNIDWFLFEDQTFGLGMVADMINRGYSANQVEKFIDIIESNESTIFEDTDMTSKDKRKLDQLVRHARFEIIEGNWDGELNRFAKLCEQIKVGEDADKYAQSLIKSGKDVHFKLDVNYSEIIPTMVNSYSLKIGNRTFNMSPDVFKDFNKKYDVGFDSFFQDTQSGFGFREIREVSDQERNLYDKSVNDNDEYLNIKPVSGISTDEARDFWNNIFSDTQSGFFDEDHKQRRALSKELNKMDQKLAWDKRFYYDTVRNTRKFEQQLDKIKDPRSKEYKLVKSRLDASYDDILKKAKGIEKYEKQILDRVDELEQRGYKIKERPISRRTMTKGEIAKSIGLTLFQSMLRTPMVFVPTNKVIGMKYSVKASKQRDPDFKHSEKEREIAAKVKEHGYSSLTDYEKKVYNKAYK